MSNKNNKFKYIPQHKRAIMHMIGQFVECFGSKPTTAEIAAWMNVTKVTARKHLKRMEDNGLLIMNKKPYRNNTEIHTWELTHWEYDKYKAKQFTQDYQFYAQRVMQLILQ